MHILVLYRSGIDNIGFKLQIFQVVSAILNCNMKVFTISNLVAVIFAITMIAKATGKITSVPRPFLLEFLLIIINLESTNMD